MTGLKPFCKDCKIPLVYQKIGNVTRVLSCPECEKVYHGVYDIKLKEHLTLDQKINKFLENNPKIAWLITALAALFLIIGYFWALRST
jgi:uncharacterized Zn finger protein (UPF0148 family)